MADAAISINNININAMRGGFMDIFCPESPFHPVVKTLLKDRTTKKNIVWATDLYRLYSNGYFPEGSQMTDWAVKDLMSCGVMLPRVLRTKR